MSLFVKICGCRTREAIAVAVAAGADALGFVFAESPRRLQPEQARRLCAGLPDHVIRVAVMRHPSPYEWQSVRRAFEPDWLQADADSFASLDLGEDTRALPVYRDVAGLDEERLAGESRALFEAASSGAGMRADWTRAARLAERTQVVLAGGLAPDNVAEAIRRVRPWGVDVSSGIERRRGEKDLDLIEAFVQNAKAAGAEIA